MLSKWGSTRGIETTSSNSEYDMKHIWTSRGGPRRNSIELLLPTVFLSSGTIRIGSGCASSLLAESMTIRIPASENVASGAVQNQEECCLVVLVSAAGCSEVAHAALVSGPAGSVDFLAHPIPLRKNLLSQVKGSIGHPNPDL